MGRKREQAYDPYIEICLTHGLRSDNRTRGFSSITDACTDLGIPDKRLYSANSRGVHDIRVIGDLAILFRLPKAIYLGYVSQYAGDIYDLYSASSKAS